MFAIIIALLCLDFSNALWQTRENRRDLNGFLVVKEGIVKTAYPVKEACAGKGKSCTRIALDIGYEEEKKRDNQTTVYLDTFDSAQIGQLITLLCDPQQNMCLPRSHVQQLRSVWLATRLSHLFS